MFVVVSCSLTHLLVYSSTHGPSALSDPARRTARCAIKSAATRRVGACLDSFSKNSSNSLNSKESSQDPRIPPCRGHASSCLPLSLILASVGAPSRSQNRSKNRCKLRCHFGVVLGASWVPFGLPFGASWPPKLGQVRSESRPSCAKSRFSKKRAPPCMGARF